MDLSGQTYLDPAVGPCFETEATFYSPTGFVLFGWYYLFCQWTCATCQLCFHSEWHVACLSLSHSFISFFLSFSFSSASAPEAVSDPTDSGPLAISSSWCGYCYWCYGPLLGLLYSGFPSLFMTAGLVLYTMCILPCRNSGTVAHMLCKITLSYTIRWLPYIWAIVLPKLIHVIKVVQLLFFFQD